MIKSEAFKNNEKVCDLRYLNEMMLGQKLLIREMIDIILKDVPEELKSINLAISKTDYAMIKYFAHIMQTSVLIMGISILTPVLRKMEELAKAEDIEKIIQQNRELNLICKQAFEELKIQNGRNK